MFTSPGGIGQPEHLEAEQTMKAGKARRNSKYSPFQCEDTRITVFAESV